jgi:hypothetical protein
MAVDKIQAIEQSEYSNEQCNNKLDQLECRVDLDFPFVKNENWTFSIMKDQVQLHIDITPDKLAQANLLISKLLTYYKQNDSSGYEESFYPWGRYTGIGEESIMLDINNAFDTSYITKSEFENIFGVNFEENKHNLIHFLHKLLWVKQIDWNNVFDYNDKVDNTENQQIIESVEEIQKTVNDKFTWKNIKEILNINSNISREESFANLLFLFNKKFDIQDLWINTSRSFMELTYDNITYIWWENESLHWRWDVSFEYKGGAFINIKQWGTTLAQFRMNNYNDQIILNQLVWNTNADDYSVPSSYTKHLWERPATDDELKNN